MRQNVIVDLQGPDESVKAVVNKIFSAVIQEMKESECSFSICRKDVTEESIRLPVAGNRKE